MRISSAFGVADLAVAATALKLPLGLAHAAPLMLAGQPIANIADRWTGRHPGGVILVRLIGPVCSSPKQDVPVRVDTWEVGNAFR